MEICNVTEVCYPHYAICREDKTPMYLPKWKLPPTVLSSSSFDRLCPKPWRYHTSEETNNLPKVTPRETYGGGGYVADLGYDLQTARYVMENLNENSWIDRRTRAVVLEFNIFNSNMNILVVAQYFFEFLPTGGVFNYVSVQMLNLYGTETGLVQVVLLCRLLLLVMIIAFSVIQVVKMYRQRKSYFKSFWNWLILALIITSITSVVLHIFRERAAKDTVKELQRNIYAMVSFHKPLRLLHFETAALSIVIFLATVKLLRLLRFSKQTVFLSITVRFAGKYLLSFSFVFIIIFCSFAMSGMMAFGSVVESYSSFPRACVAQFEFLLGKAVPNFQMARVNPFLSFVFFSLYICSMTVFFLNLFIVILNCALEEVKNNLDSVADELDLAEFMISYLFQGISNLFGWEKRKNCKLYCESMTFEDECAYIEKCLIEIEQRLFILSERTFPEERYRLKKDRMVNTSLFQTQSHLINSETGSDSKVTSLQQADRRSMSEEETLDSPEREVVVEVDCDPSNFTVKEMIENCEQTINRTASPSQIHMATEYEENY